MEGRKVRDIVTQKARNRKETWKGDILGVINDKAWNRALKSVAWLICDGL